MRGWTEDPAGIFGDTSVSINVGDTTTIIGGAIVSETEGGLELVTGDLVVQDVAINDYAQDEYTGVQVNVDVDGIVTGKTDGDIFNSNSYGSIEHSDVGHDKEGVIKGTISGGTVTIGDETLDTAALEDMGINTDADNIITITKDESWEESFKIDLVNVGVVAEQVDNLVNVVQSFTAKVPDYVKAQGEAAEDLWRKSIANGKSQAEATDYINSAPAQELIGWRNKIQNKIDDKGGIDAMTQQEVSLLLQQEVVSFADHIYQENCASGPIGIGVCDDFAAGYGISTEDLTDPDVLAGLISKLSTDINSLESEEDKVKMQSLLNLAINCSQKWLDSMSQPDNPNYINDEEKRREHVDNFVNSDGFSEVVGAMNAVNGTNVTEDVYATIYKAQTGTLDSIEQKYLNFDDISKELQGLNKKDIEGEPVKDSFGFSTGDYKNSYIDQLRNKVKKEQGSAYSEEQFLAEVAYYLIKESEPKSGKQNLQHLATSYWKDEQVASNLGYDITLLNQMDDVINGGEVPEEYQGLSNTEQAIKMLEEFGFETSYQDLKPKQLPFEEEGKVVVVPRVFSPNAAGAVYPKRDISITPAVDPVTGDKLYIMTGSSTSRYLGLNSNAGYDVGAHEVGHVLQNKHIDNVINNLDANGNACNGSSLCQDTRTLMVSALYYHRTSKKNSYNYYAQPIEGTNHVISRIFGQNYGATSQAGHIESIRVIWENQK